MRSAGMIGAQLRRLREAAHNRADDRQPAPNLRELARRVERLCPSRARPEAFRIEKSEIAHELRRFARDSEICARGDGARSGDDAGQCRGKGNER